MKQRIGLFLKITNKKYMKEVMPTVNYDGWYSSVVFIDYYMSFLYLCDEFSCVIHAIIHNNSDNNKIIKKFLPQWRIYYVEG